MIMNLPNFDGMRLKTEGALILCIVAVLAKTFLEKFTPKVRRTSYNFTSGKNSRSLYLANYYSETHATVAIGENFEVFRDTFLTLF